MNQFLINCIETFTNALRVISNDHAYIHAGRSFRFPHLLTLTTGTTQKITILTGATKSIHFRPARISCSADKVTVNLYEGSSGNSGGTTKTPINSNRNSLAVSEAILKEGVTVTTNGALIDTKYIGGGTGVGFTFSGSESNESEEIVLKPSTLYTIEIINGSASTNIILVALNWYSE